VALGRMLQKKYFLVGTHNARGAVGKVNYHAAASDNVELRFTHD
jgi:hypothetical protein